MTFKKFIDVFPGDWYYNEVIEASNYQMEDDSPFIASIPYNGFKSGMERFYIEITAGGQVEFDLGQSIIVCAENPLYVYIDGVQSVYKCIKDSSGTEGLTGNIVVLYAPPAVGSVVAFYLAGVPAFTPVDNEVEGRPYILGNPMYPRKPLQDGNIYYYDPQRMRANEYCYAFGRQLKRAIIPNNEWRVIDTEEKLEILLKKYIKYEPDIYVVSPKSISDFPYAAQLVALATDPKYDPYDTGVYLDYAQRSWIFLPYCLENVTLKFEYCVYDSGQWTVKGGEFRANSPSGKVMYLDRFFPKTYVTRAEAVTWLNRLRVSFYNRFTDANPAYNEGGLGNIVVKETYNAYKNQTLFGLTNHYIVGDNSLRVIKNDVRLNSSEYIEVNSNMVELKTPCAHGDIIKFYGKREHSRFVDVLDDAWYKWPIMEIEMETFKDGKYLIEGVGDNRFEPERRLNRAEAVALLNRFREWCIERFKL